MAKEKVRVNNEWVDVKDNGIGSQINASTTTQVPIGTSWTDILSVNANADDTYIMTARVEYFYSSPLSITSLDMFRIVAFDSNNYKSGKAAASRVYPTQSTAIFYTVCTTVVKGYPKYGIDGYARAGCKLNGAYITLTKIA